MQQRRTVSTEDIRKALSGCIHEASFDLIREVEDKFRNMKDEEVSPMAQETLDVLIENSRLAREKEIPLCQDCGVVIIFLEIGQNVNLEGENLYEALNQGVKEEYSEYYLRKSVVEDPLRRKNTGTNTPAFIHTDIVPGDKIKMSVYLKGGGSENMSALRMFRPTDSPELIMDYITETVKNAGPNPCPPIFLGIGIGGTADLALLNSKKAVMRGIGTEHPDPFYRDMEKNILERVNSTGVGPLGFGGNSTAGGVFIKAAPAHIATLPVAINMNCHSLRYREVVL